MTYKKVGEWEGWYEMLQEVLQTPGPLAVLEIETNHQKIVPRQGIY
jgi:hypothetical protein